MKCLDWGDSSRDAYAVPLLGAYAGEVMDLDVAIIGAGAAGLMAGAWAVRARPGARVLLLDGAPKIGAKILVAGGGRCNVTHREVDESAYAGSSRHAIKKVLRGEAEPKAALDEAKARFGEGKAGTR